MCIYTPVHKIQLSEHFVGLWIYFVLFGGGMFVEQQKPIVGCIIDMCKSVRGIDMCQMGW